MPVSKEPAPSARVTPAGAEPGHEEVPAARVHAQSGRIALRAPVAVGEDRVEKHRGEDDSRDEDHGEDDQEHPPIRHTSPRHAPRRGTHSRRSRASGDESQPGISNCFWILLHSSTYAIPSSIRSITTSAPAPIATPSRPSAGTAWPTPSCSYEISPG